jgi:predicted XRE-type DNA-binding protein
MTKIGEFLNKNSVNKAEISRRTGISTNRLSDLSLKETARLTVDELYLIALAIDIEPNIINYHTSGHLSLIDEYEEKK